ncbi:hypothetical protein ACHAXA_003354 [Cyclostephanos tholiformis]|uniref:DUF6816 domain-containing protein n=1 Tax=Cyclostephanos tholiformis TaxID=382380 RepID=A0ABD3RE12_9STRA
MVGSTRLANLWTLLGLLSLINRQTLALNIRHNNFNTAFSRRQFARRISTTTTSASIAAIVNFGASKTQSVASAITSSTPSSSSSSTSFIADRFDSDILTSPSITAGTKNTGHENLYFPQWMEGEWDVTQTLVSASAPLGIKFVGGPMGSIEIAEKTMNEQTRRLNEPVRLKLRYVRTNLGVVEDRAYNWRNRLDSFAGRSVVASVVYADVRESNRASVLASGGSASDPLMTTIVYFKGPAAQKTFVISHGQDPTVGGDDIVWSGYEFDRSIFALTNQNTAPPVTTDTEAIYSLKRIGNDRVEGRLRLAGYLNPQADQLYFEARNRAVSLNDYTLSFTRTSTTS